MYRILLIEDDQKIGDLLTEYFQKFGHELIHHLTPSTGLKALDERSFDLLILDIMLPEMDGFEVCRTIRKGDDRNSLIPIVMLTARGDVTDRIVGLELGADDYLPKPFDPRELLARIESVLRRGKMTTNSPKQKEVGDIVLNHDRRTGEYQGEDLDLTGMEFELLSLFFSNIGKVLSRDEIMNELQGIDSDVFSRSIDIAVSRLRHKLHDDSKNPKYIKTIRGKGYMFMGIEEEKGE